MEWTAARAVGPSYVTHLPVAQDGSANGLQHYAALMRDQESAEAVNLVNQEVPADIYSQVADRVKGLLDEKQLLAFLDKEPMVEEHKFWLEYAGDWRKLCKTPCMTLPYGVTNFGIKEQLHEAVVDAMGQSDRERSYMPECQWLAPIIFEAIADVVGAATTCMGWLKEVARAGAEEGLDVRWTTSTGVPVETEYRQVISTQVEIWVAGERRRLRLGELTDQLHLSRSVHGISPNFVHSLDAAHLMMTVNKAQCDSLAMVHDSYATLACDVAELSLSIREAFIELHTQPQLELLREQLVRHFDVPELPAKGDFDIQEVLAATYFFA
jgi:DNA-directed RNA polymerase